MSDLAVGMGNHSNVKSKQFGFEAMFPRKNIDSMFKDYFSKSTSDDGFIALHGEMQKLDLMT